MAELRAIESMTGCGSNKTTASPQIIDVDASQGRSYASLQAMVRLKRMWLIFSIHRWSVGLYFSPVNFSADCFNTQVVS